MNEMIDREELKLMKRIEELTLQINEIRDPKLVFPEKDYNNYTDEETKKLKILYTELYELLDPIMYNIDWEIN